jgi:spore coat polysaccharide biosynthesis protein SpsF
MPIAAIVQARTSSVRLPGKVLRPIAGKPLLQYLIERLERAQFLDGIVVATSDEPADDMIESFCVDQGIDCHRGPLDDVAGRMLAAAASRGLDAFVRISGDSPLLDQRLVDLAVSLLTAPYELTTNIARRTFPHGQSVEAIRTDTLARGYASMTAAADFEHVTPFFYRHADEFRIASFESETDLSGLTLSVDTQADLARFASIVASLDRPHWDYDLPEIVALAHEKTDSGSA